MNIMLGLITVLSLIVATTMATVAWRLRREEDRRSRARVAALESALGEFDWQPEEGFGPTAGGLFAGEEPRRDRSRLVAVVLVGAFAVATALALIIVTSRAW